MKLYAFTIEPTATLGSPLKGDMLFGHFCWQADYDPNLLNGGLTKWVGCYPEQPFAIFSSAWPKLHGSSYGYAVKRPDLPAPMLLPYLQDRDRKQRLREYKENMKKKWLLLGEDLKLSLSRESLVNDHAVLAMATTGEGSTPRVILPAAEKTAVLCGFSEPHNSISRLTMTTGEGMFAPRTELALSYAPGVRLVIFVLLEPAATDAEKVRTGLEQIGKAGYGKDASTGKGRFRVVAHHDLPLPHTPSANACYTLGPSVPERDTFSEQFFSPFVRFGKHGDQLAKSNRPFKNPVIMADEGAVFVPKNSQSFSKPYLGRSVHNTSAVLETTVAQGYSIYLPLRLEGLHGNG